MNKTRIILATGIIIVLVAVFLQNQVERRAIQKNSAPKTTPSSAQLSIFPEYDLIPENLKKQMAALKAREMRASHSFCYFFDLDDVNTNYFVRDANVIIIGEQPVSNSKVFSLLDKKIADSKNASLLHSMHPYLNNNLGETQQEAAVKYKKIKENKADPSLSRIMYVVPENPELIDYSKLKVAIMQQTVSNFPKAIVRSKIYEASEVDSLPEPVRGYDYLEKVIVEELLRQDVFSFYDLKGTVKIDCIIGGAAYSPNIREGFASQSENYEAFQADGAFVKAINQGKVHWKPGYLHGKPVQVKMPLTFQVDGTDISLLNSPFN